MRRSTRPSRTPRRTTSLAATVLTASLALTACGGSADEETPAPKAEKTEEVVVPETWPLTGLEAAEGESVERDHPIFVVKVDNSGKGSQVGLSQADMIFEQLVEGGTTRLAAFYYSQLPEAVGPVRSLRASDIGIIAGTGAHVVTSGAAVPTIQRIKKAGIPILEEGAVGISRDRSRSYLYSVMANLTEMAAEAKTSTARPDDYFNFGAVADLPAGEPASRVAVDFGNHTSQWEFGTKAWKYTNSFAEQGDEFNPDTLLVLGVGIEDAGYKDPGGAFVPESVFNGEGEAHIFHGGTVLKGTWSKDGLDGDVTLEVDGTEVEMPAGKVFVELLPPTGKVTVTP